jgi:putative hydroxymethylpyrimidine transporter CytX
MSENLPKLLSSPGSGMSFFPALDIVIAMPISWMPIAADYNRFAKNSNSALRATIIGFAITNILFYFGGILLGVTDVVLIIGAIQSIFFGFLILILIVSETDNTFADVYSAAVSTQNIYHKINQRYLIVGFTSVSTILAMMIPIAQYETFILLIGAVFVPLFGVVLSDYYIVRNRKYTEDMLFGKSALKIGFTAIISWSVGVVIYYLLSPLSPIHMAELPKIGATIPSIIVSSSLYLIMVRLKGHRERKVREPAS